jgi:glucose/arabinose dehydrogenase
MGSVVGRTIGSATGSVTGGSAAGHHRAGRRRCRFVALAALLALSALGLAACLPPAEPGAPTLWSTTFVGGLSKPWDLAFLPDGTPVYTENDSGLISARLSDADPHHALGQVSTFDAFDPSGEGGLMGLAIDPAWSTNHRAYACYSTPVDNRVASFILTPAASPAIGSWQVILSGIPHNSFHDGCRLRFRPGTDELFVSTGDAGLATGPQSDTVLAGKILRITTAGTAYPTNASGQRWYTKGHRNPQGLAFRPGTDQVFDDEHGPDVNDEVNLLVDGGNAGWNPDDGLGGYDQSKPMTGPGATILPTWQSGGVTVAPSGSTFLSGAQWKGWDGALVVACLDGSPAVGQRLLAMHLSADGKSLTGPPVTAMALGVRLRAAVQGPDGNLYLLTDRDAGTGEIWKVVPL